MTPRRALGGWVVLATFAGAAGCSASAPGDGADGGAFVAQNADFKGYQTWTSFTIDDLGPGGSTHVAGKRTIYINHEPPAGATEFPIGTIIVKETAADGKIFARAKRGGDPPFNKTGAVGWEWFELKTVSMKTGIDWRGNGPRAGEMYGGDPNAGCNPCHKLAVANDYVLTSALMLTAAGAGADGGAPGDGEGADGSTDDAATDAGAAETSLDTGAELESGLDDASHE